jgi:hypothetical protein
MLATSSVRINLEDRELRLCDSTGLIKEEGSRECVVIFTTKVIRKRETFI